jgi:hypothetical protein
MGVYVETMGVYTNDTTISFSLGIQYRPMSSLVNVVSMQGILTEGEGSEQMTSSLRQLVL